MSILIDKDTKLVVSGITGREGTFHALNNRRYGTQVVAGVTPGKGGQDVEGIPVFNTFMDAVKETGANTAMIFVPPRFAADSILEAADAGITTIVAITEAVEVILANEKVTAVLFNIFGGITRCDEVAKGLIEAFNQISPTVPFVVRLDGTNDVEGRELLAEAALPNVHVEATMDAAAAKVVELAA